MFPFCCQTLACFGAASGPLPVSHPDRCLVSKEILPSTPVVTRTTRTRPTRMWASAWHSHLFICLCSNLNVLLKLKGKNKNQNKPILHSSLGYFLNCRVQSPKVCLRKTTVKGQPKMPLGTTLGILSMQVMDSFQS